MKLCSSIGTVVTLSLCYVLVLVVLCDITFVKLVLVLV